jgi:hypothetical protein
MRNTISKTTPVAAILVLAGHLMAGGFYLQLGNPEASPEARKANAVLTFQVAGCHDPAAATVSASAIGVVNGQRREIALKVDTLSAPGLYAIAQQWPREGKWVIKLVARNGEMFTNSLVSAGPSGIDRYNAKADMKEFPGAAVDAMLR